MLFAEPDPSFIQMASVLSPTYAETMGPGSGGRRMWPVIDVGPGRTNEDFVRDLRADYVGDAVDPLVRFAESPRDLIDTADAGTYWCRNVHG